MPRAYIYAKLEDEMALRHLRDRMSRVVDTEGYYRPIAPHMTIIPPFIAEEGTQLSIKEAVGRSQLKGSTVKFSTLSVFENIHKPKVICLKADPLFGDKRENLVEKISKDMQREPTKSFRPHVSLLKFQIEDMEPPTDVKRSIQREIKHTPCPQSTEITNVKVEIE